jgi:flagellin-like protein
MRRLFKSKKALSPVVAAIILIAVTVAVSIAVAAWMGALTFTFMKTEELKIQSHTWASDRSYIDLSVKNTGTSALTLDSARVNDVVTTSNITSSGTTLQPGGSAVVRITPTSAFTSGVKYEFAVLTKTANKYAYVATAP